MTSSEEETELINIYDAIERPAEFQNFHPLIYIDTTYNKVAIAIKDEIHRLKSFLEKQKVNPDKIEKIVDFMNMKMESILTSEFNNLDLLVSHQFRLPQDMYLPTDVPNSNRPKLSKSSFFRLMDKNLELMKEIKVTRAKLDYLNDFMQKLNI